MGIEYYAINTQNKTFYDLGKGGWYALTDMEAFQDEEYLCNEILTECFYIDEEDDWRKPEEKERIINHVKTRVAPDLFNMMKNTPTTKIRIINDCVDDITICKSKRYMCIGTRYYDIDSPEYQKSMQFNNRHLEDTPINKCWYDTDKYKDLPGYDEY